MFEDAFYKLLNIKDEINLLCYYSDEYPEHNVLTISIFEIYDNYTVKFILKSILTVEKQGCKYYNSDFIFLTETKAIYTALHFHGKKFSLYVLNYFGNYKYLILNQFILNVQGKSLYINRLNSP